jgi:uncharacterized protein YcaQ
LREPPIAINISNTIRRRFILGKQGLWPGRRWHGKQGLDEALRAVQGVQIDPVSILAQSHDLVLWGRVLDYKQEHLSTLMYTDRQFFDYGGALFIYPMNELPYWRLTMERMHEVERWKTFAADNRDSIDLVRQELQARGPRRKRDFGGKLIEHYRGSKVSGVSLYYLWLVGELMTHHRVGKERVYDFRENIAPADLDFRADISEAEHFFAIKTFHMRGLVTERILRNGWKGFINRGIRIEEVRAKVEELLDKNIIEHVEIEGKSERRFAISRDIPLLEMLLKNKLPDEWEPIGSTTDEEVIFLSPLEYVSARGRAEKLFDFDYIWEIYKPGAKRQYGPYTLPILYGDRLVGRIDAKFNHQEDQLIINGLWLEQWFKPNKNFMLAFGRGLSRLLTFLGASRIILPSLITTDFHTQLEEVLGLIE